MTTYRLTSGPDWSRGIVSVEPPQIGKPFAAWCPRSMTTATIARGIRLPEIAVPLATQNGWNFRRPALGAPDRLAGEIGSYLPLRDASRRERSGDGRLSIEERYATKAAYLDRIAAAARELVEQHYVLAEDVPDLVARAAAHYDWATGR